MLIDLKIFPVSEVQILQVKVQKLWITEIMKSMSTSNALHAGKHCFHYGDPKHQSSECRHENTTYHSCKKPGHQKYVKNMMNQNSIFQENLKKT